MNPIMVVHGQIRMDGKKKVNLGRACWVWCPGCNEAHRINVIGEDGTRDTVIWEWDGNLERPTFNPSILVHQGTKQPRCHSYIKAGQWQFLSDCTHKLAGQTVDMIPLPNWLVNENDKEEE